MNFTTLLVKWIEEEVHITVMLNVIPKKEIRKKLIKKELWRQDAFKKCIYSGDTLTSRDKIPNIETLTFHNSSII